MLFDTLENRRLYSVSASVDANGVVSVAGTPDADRVSIIESDGTVYVQETVVDEWGMESLVTVLTAENATRVKVDLGDGDDTIEYYGSTVGADITAASGADFVTVSDGDGTVNLGGRWSDTPSASIVDARGNSTGVLVQVLYGQGTTVYGGDGDDYIVGPVWAGDADIYAGDGDDTVVLFGQGSFAHGGSGNNSVTIVSDTSAVVDHVSGFSSIEVMPL